ncbi:MAG TPA: PepSY-associated TM helix domain-containing protein [Chitinophagales bacterium]|nr:PepSY-associated TM helix domain-containing protein [Chitinophagales bacterium]
MKKKEIYTFKKLIGDLHLWLGVASGIILFVICFTGTIYVFKTEIEEYLEPHKYNIEAQQQILPIEILIANTEKETKGKVSRIAYTDNQTRPYEINVKTDPEDRRGTNFMVNQYTGKVIGSVKGPATEFFFTMFKLHRWLLLDMEKGRPITGAATLIFTFLCLSGFILWLPKKIKGLRSFKPGLTIMWRARWKRINHDLHNVLGFYSLIFLLIMSLTGLTWSYEWYNNGLYKLLTGKEMEQKGGPGGGKGNKGEKGKKDNKSIEAQESIIIPTITYEKALDIANTKLAYQGKTIINKIAQDGSPYEVIKFNKDRFNEEAADKLTINATSGNIEKVELFDDLSLGERVMKQIRGLHVGTTYGMWSKVIYFIVCLIATSLPITGIIIWINKMKFGSSTD